MRIPSLAVLAATATQAAAFFILPCSRPVVVERADPIVTPGGVAAHVHTIMGGSGFNFSMTYEQAISGACSTCKIKQDMSNYWIPNLYYQRQDGKFEDVKQSGGMLVYYLHRSDSRDPEFGNGLLAFPEGFQMLAGDPYLRSYENTLEQRAISYACLGVSGPETNGFPDHNCPNGLRAQVTFPSCWDGVNLDSPDHQSHMAYPDLMDNGKCPDSHPKRFMTLFYEVTFQVDEFKDRWHGDSQPFVFSNGDPTGYGLHGDFVNGWDLDVLQTAIDECKDVGGSVEACDAFDFFDDETMRGCKVPVQVDEQITGTLDKLAGCNAVQAGPRGAVVETGCGATMSISAPQWPYKDMTDSHKFKYNGCTRDASGRGRTLQGASISGDDMTIARCLEFCEGRGFKYAGLEFRRECYCGNSVAADRAPRKGVLGVCESPCAGDDNEICGGYGVLSLYEKCESGDACENAELM